MKKKIYILTELDGEKLVGAKQFNSIDEMLEELHKILSMQVLARMKEKQEEEADRFRHMFGGVF